MDNSFAMQYMDELNKANSIIIAIDVAFVLLTNCGSNDNNNNNNNDTDAHTIKHISGMLNKSDRGEQEKKKWKYKFI